MPDSDLEANDARALAREKDHVDDAAPDVPSAAPGDVPHPETVWRRMPKICIEDRYGYGRIPAFWFTLNFPYNYSYELHRFHGAVEQAKRSGETGSMQDRPPTQSALPNMDTRVRWVLDNPDIAAFLHALRVELNVRYVMANIVHCDDEEPFQYWLRYEWGSNGNPHAHGQVYVTRNPNFECLIPDEETRQLLIDAKYQNAKKLKAKEEEQYQLQVH